MIQKRLIFLLFVLTPLLASSQFLLNAGFEDWEPVMDFENPIGWETNNQAFYPSVEMSSDAFTGDYAALITGNFPTFEGQGPGRLWINIPASEGIPSNLKVHVKHFDFQDSSHALIQLTAYSQGIGTSEIIWFNEVEQADWVQLDIPIDYDVDESLIDSVQIQFIGGSIITGLGFNGNGVLLVDNIHLQGVNTSVQQTELSESKLSVFPNPAYDLIQVDLRNLPYGWYDIQVTDLTGRTLIVMEQVGSFDKTPIEVQQLPPGQYLLSVVNEERSYQAKFQIIK